MGPGHLTTRIGEAGKADILPGLGCELYSVQWGVKGTSQERRVPGALQAPLTLLVRMLLLKGIKPDHRAKRKI